MPGVPLARQESLSDEVEWIEDEESVEESTFRGPTYLNGASHGSTGLPPPLHQYEFERPAGVDFWHKERQPSPYIFNRSKHQYVWGSDRPINGDELGDWNLPSSRKTAPSPSTRPLDVLERRKSFTQRPIAIVSGTHGAWHGNNWDDTGARDASLHEQAFLSEDIESRLSGHFAPNPAGVFEGYHGGIKVMGDLIGFILKRDSKNGLEYYVSTSAKKGSFESRIRIYDGAKMTEPDVRGLIANLGNHVILGYCFSRNDEALRYKGAATPSAPVTSFDSPKELPLGFAPGYGIFARPRTFITDGGSTTPVPVGAFIEDVPGRGNRLKITGPGSRPTITGPYPELWLPPSFSPLDPQAPTEAVYNKHHP